MGSLLWDGTKLYHYTIRNGKFTVKEGIVRESNKKWSYPYVEFDYGRQVAPRMYKIGELRTGGPSLWLLERDDELAKKMFLEYEEECLRKLEEDVEKRRRLIESIKEGVEDGKTSNN